MHINIKNVFKYGHGAFALMDELKYFQNKYYSNVKQSIKYICLNDVFINYTNFIFNFKELFKLQDIC